MLKIAERTFSAMIYMIYFPVYNEYLSHESFYFVHNSPDVLMTLSMCFTRHEVVVLD